MPEIKNDIVYVVRNESTGDIEMATTNDFEAWCYYRDVPTVSLSVFIKKNMISYSPPSNK
ncbi:hypothetical protein [Paenibacillus sp. PAMC 26794]|uniref:hypothetical protein n=1 Tax=Paenibacillus sp. PAMC 26794 TaxID=1257080 RepID=UPI0003082781|nr:hypothetical protein [Paenibacillus sp. PAMC 26794]